MSLCPIYPVKSFKIMKKYALHLIWATMLFTSCETEIDLIADPVETAVIYGTLSPNDSAQYIKINPTFVGEKDAADLAQDPNTINYDDILDVKLVNLSSDQEYSLVRTLNEIPKDEGYFTNDANVLYKLSTPLDINDQFLREPVTSILDPESRYKILVTNKESGEEFWSETNILDVNNQTISRPRSSSPKQRISFASEFEYIEYTFRFTPVEHAYRYELYLVFNYQELRDPDTSNNPVEQIEILIGEAKGTTNVSENVNIVYDGEQFYQKIRNELGDGDDVLRLGNVVDLKLVAVCEDISTYADASAPSNSIVQERPTFTNIENGLGIFGCRSVMYFNGYYLNEDSSKELREGEYTAPLNFCSVRYNTVANYNCD